jgi:uncharacterized protein YfaS (alpha-2-macroglobulin family)
MLLVELGCLCHGFPPIWGLIMFKFLAKILILVLSSSAVQAQEGPVPERWLSQTRNLDFNGGDLTPIFDTSLDACRRACLADAACVAMTFNTRSNACFPKHTIGATQSYDGAVSARIYTASPRILRVAPEAATRLSMLRPVDLRGAFVQAQSLGDRFAADESDARELQRAGANALASNAELAIAYAAAAITVSGTSEYWQVYAQYLVGDNRDSQRGERAIYAAVNAYLRAGSDRASADALEVMATALEAVGRGEDMIPVLRLAARHVTGAGAVELARARDLYGFRQISTDVESNNANPRICAVFSEQLSQAGVDYAPFVGMEQQGIAVEVTDQQLCLTGVHHGTRYAFTLREGLPSASGEVLSRSVEMNVYVRDRMPQVRFNGSGYVLPATGERALPVETVNVQELNLVLRRVSDRNLAATLRTEQFGQQLSNWEVDDFNSQMSEEVWRGTGQVQSALNQTMLTRMPLSDVGPMEPGVYILEASLPDADPNNGAPAMQWFMVSDLGVSALSGADGVHVVVQALSSALPVAGANVALISRANRILATQSSDEMGHVLFEAALALGTGSSAPALVLVETGSQDMAFLSLSSPEFDLSDRGVEGLPAAGPVDVFLTTDRGAYRAGETVHVTALARDKDARAIDGLPLTARLIRPDGVEYSRALAASAPAGGHVFAMGLGGTAPRGVWRLEILANPTESALASQTLLVEDFLPERIDFDLALPSETVDLRAGPSVSLEARYLFGAPAGDLPLEGSIALRATSRLDAWPGFQFGRQDQTLDPQRRFFPSGSRTNADGILTVALPIEGLELPNRPMTVDVTVAISDGSGRPVERMISRPITLYAPVVGIHPTAEDTLPENSTAEFDLIAVTPDGSVASGPLAWQLDRVETRYQWYSVGGRWSWDPVITRSRIAQGQVELADAAARISVPVAWGQYELRVERSEGGRSSASVQFSAGWYAPASARETPDMLDMSLDATSYAPGEIATLRMVARDDGMALVSVLSSGVIDMQLVAVRAGENTLTLPVTDDWGTGVYVTAAVVRAMDAATGQMPARSLGLAHASVAPGNRALDVVLTAPLEAMPRDSMTVTLEAGAGMNDGPVYATIAAVDLGILNLTGFDRPDPSAHYFGQRRLGVALRDMYGRLIDGSQGALGAVRSGGDAGAQRNNTPPPTEALLALFSGTVVLIDGRAEVSFDLPAFNGTVRLMAVVWSDRGVGQAEADVLVRDPVVVQATLPRFLSPGDTSRLLLEFNHATGPSGEMALGVTGDGIDSALVPGTITLAALGQDRLSIPVRALAPGVHEIEVTLTPPGGTPLTRILQLSVQSNDPEIARSSRFSLAPGQTFSFDDQALAGMQAGTARASLIAGPAAGLDAPGLIQRLLRYPYRCTEQVTSRAMPMLYATSMVNDLGLGTALETETMIGEAIARVLTNQAANGGFGLWYAQSGDLWLDAYVTDFLSRARSLGHAVPDVAFRMALDNLRNQLNAARDFDTGGAPYAYALLVLAQQGEAAIGDLRYFADTRAAAFDTPMASAQLGAALAAYGDQTRADEMFHQAEQQIGAPPRLGWRGDYGTDRRDIAGVLTLAIEAGSDAVDRNALAVRVAARAALNQLSTQEAMWSLMAAAALEETGAGLSLNGDPVTGTLVRLYDGSPAQVRNDGTEPVTVTLTTFGVPDVPEPAGGNAYAISRSYFALTGEAMDPTSVAIGTRMVAVLDIIPFDNIGGRLMVNDPLPAGFEIDNPNLLRTGDVAALDWLRATSNVEMTEARDDRYLAAVDWRTNDTLRLAYIVRAVSPGQFHHPAASVEDMYRPERRGQTAAGQVIVTQ